MRKRDEFSLYYHTQAEKGKEFIVKDVLNKNTAIKEKNLVIDLKHVK